MEETTAITTTNTAWKTRALVIGAILGAAVGAMGAYLYIQNVEPEEELEITAGQGVKLGILLFGLLRNVANLGE
jgi:hypothetical protein